VTRLAHSRSGVATREPRPQNALHPTREIRKWTLLPSNARVQYRHLIDKQPELLRRAEDSVHNRLNLAGRRGVIACGIANNYFLENVDDGHDLSVLSLAQYPVPAGRIRRLVEHVDDLLVLEDGYPVVENMVRGLFGLNGVRIRGRMTGEVPRTGELNPDLVRSALELPPHPTAHQPSPSLAGRPPALCKGCPHTDTFRPSTRLSPNSRTRRSSANRLLHAGSVSAARGDSLLRRHGGEHRHGGRGRARRLPPGGRRHRRQHLLARRHHAAAVGGAAGGQPQSDRARQRHGRHDRHPALDVDRGRPRPHHPGRRGRPGAPADHRTTPANHAANVQILRDELAWDGTSVIIARRTCLEAIKRKVS